MACYSSPALLPATHPWPPAAPAQVHEEGVTLHGSERVVVHLRVVPLRPGSLQVHGLAWLLNGTAHGQAAFRIPQPCPRKPGSSSK